jgi:hypothetical protein
LCCTTFLPAFQPVSIRMAKDQGMVLNPSKLAGQCGRLKCCLVYEHSTYKEMGKGLPKVGKKVVTPSGPGRVLDLDILAQRVRVLLEEGGAQTFAAAEVRSLHAAGGGGSDKTPDPGDSDAGDSADAVEPVNAGPPLSQLRKRDAAPAGGAGPLPGPAAPTPSPPTMTDEIA